MDREMRETLDWAMYVLGGVKCALSDAACMVMDGDVSEEYQQMSFRGMETKIEDVVDEIEKVREYLKEKEKANVA